MGINLDLVLFIYIKFVYVVGNVLDVEDISFYRFLRSGKVKMFGDSLMI